jgi:hypothetical protein
MTAAPIAPGHGVEHLLAGERGALIGRDLKRDAMRIEIGQRREADLRFARIAVADHNQPAGRNAFGFGQIALHLRARQGSGDKRLHRRKDGFAFRSHG